MTTRAEDAKAWQVGAAFLAVYVVWGSTYLAIRVAIETLPPFLMAGTRFLTAGAVLYVLGRLSGAPAPSPRQWRPSLLLGALFFLGGNGGVVWAEGRGVASGLAALLVATTPLWTVLFEWWRGAETPTLGIGIGLVAGLGGVGLLVAPGDVAAGAPVDLRGAGACMLSSLSWSFASVRSRELELPRSPAIASSLQMLCGGALLTGAGVLTGEVGALAPEVSLRSVAALGYLVVFGSLVTFTAFTWLLRVSTPSRVATCAYVNPVVAVLLGWALAAEPLTARTLLAAAVIVGAVVVITTTRTRRRRPDRYPPVTEPEVEVG